MRLPVLALGLASLLATPSAADAVQVDALDPLRAWHLRALRIEGAERVPAGDLRDAMSTRTRAWFALWRAWPLFDPVAFRTDLERLAALYRSRGYYHARLVHDLAVDWDADLVDATIWVDEGPPTRVVALDLVQREPLPDVPPPETLRAGLALAEGDVFDEADYERSRMQLAAAFRTRGRARVQVGKRAVVDVRDDTARVEYTIDPGPVCVFGRVAVEGLTRVDPDVVRREIAWRRGARFDQALVDETRKRLQELRLFRTVRLNEDDSRAPVVQMTVAVTEAKPREVRFGIGYETEDEIRGIAAWRDYDFFGDARQLGFTARVSALRRTLAADFLQPHWPTRESRVRLVFTQEQQDEDTYTLNQTRLAPRLEWTPTRRVTAFAYYRAELDLLSGVPRPVRLALPQAHPSETVLSGAALGVDWNATDDLADPTRGFTTRLVVEPVGGPFGGDVSFLRVVGEGRGYVPLGLGLVGAGRVRIGTEEPLGDTRVVPLWERFYAGGIDSVRGYARRRVGPLARDEPLGGQSLLESSVELRRQVTERFGLAVFADGGQVALDSATYGIDRMQWGTGFGVRLHTPVGPVRGDLGFPLDRRGDDAAWQVYLSVGQTF